MEKILCLIVVCCVTLCAAHSALAQDTIRWSAHMKLPPQSEQRQYRTSDTAPYIVCYPDFGDMKSYIEYLVDFRAEHLPSTTYLCVLNWYSESSQLKRQYKSVTRDLGLAGYCGFQSLRDGSRVAIMSIWDTFCTDAQGKTTVIKARLTYPSVDPTDQFRQINTDNGRIQWGNEGRFAQCLVPYEWKEDHSYRASVQIFNSSSGENAYLVFGVRDLETDVWTMLMRFDLGYNETYITSGCVFLENYDPGFAGELRSMVLSNFRARNYFGGEWTDARRAYFEQYGSHAGSYNYGAEDGRFWAITTGIPGLCVNPADGRYSLK